MKFSIGDRVKVVDPEGYIQPWRNRFKSGRIGTIIGLPDKKVMRDQYRIQWDHKTTRPYNFRLSHSERELEVAMPVNLEKNKQLT